jgi:hypothetical protein
LFYAPVVVLCAPQQVRPALVDLPEDQLAAPNNDINMDEADNYGLELDW